MAARALLGNLGAQALTGGVGVVWACHGPLEDVERHDELVRPVDVRQVELAARLVARHPRTADRRLQDGCALLEAALQLHAQVELDVVARVLAHHGQQDGVGLVGGLHELRGERVAVEGACVVLGARVGLAAARPDERRVHVVDARDILAPELLGLGPFGLARVELDLLDFHAVLEDGHLARVLAGTAGPARVPRLLEALERGIRPLLHVLRARDVGVEAPAARPHLASEARGLHLLDEQVSQRVYRAGLQHRVGRVVSVHPQAHADGYLHALVRGRNLEHERLGSPRRPADVAVQPRCRDRPHRVAARRVGVGRDDAEVAVIEV